MYQKLYEAPDPTPVLQWALVSSVPACTRETGVGLPLLLARAGCMQTFEASIFVSLVAKLYGGYVGSMMPGSGIE